MAALHGLGLYLLCAGMAYGQVQASAVNAGPQDVHAVRTGRIDTRSGPREMAFGLFGRIEQMTVEPGDRVSKAQLLARLNCTLQQADLSRARAELQAHTLAFERRARGPRPQEMAAAQARLASATAALASEQTSLRRQEALFKMKNLIPEQAIEAARQRVLTAQVEVAAAQASLDRMQTPILPEDEAENAAQERVLTAAVVRAGYQATLCEIHSPVDGVVAMVHRRAGEIVASTDTVLTLVDDTERRIALWLPDLAQESLRPDRKLKVRLPGGAKLIGATVESIAPIMTTASGRTPTHTALASTGVVVWLSSSAPLSAFPLYSPVEVYLR